MAHCRSATRSLVRWRCCRAPVSAPGTARCHACAGFACLFSGASPRMRGSLRALALNHPGHPGPGQGPRPPKACAPQCGGMGGAAAVPLAKPNKNTPMRRPVFWPGHWQFLKWTGVRLLLLLHQQGQGFQVCVRYTARGIASCGLSLGITFCYCCGASEDRATQECDPSAEVADHHRRAG